MAKQRMSPPRVGNTPASPDRGFTRRDWVKLAAQLGAGMAAVSAAIAGCDTQAPTPGGSPGRPGSFDWRNFAGQTIRVIDKFGPANQFYETQVPVFEKLTGIKVEYEMSRDQDVRNKMSVLFAAGETSVDIFNSTTVQDGVRFLKGGWYAPLDPFIRDRSLTAPDFDLKDFLEGPLSTAKVQPQNVLVGLPQDTEPSLLYFNKSLFDRNGAPHPKGAAWKWKDLEESLLRLHRPEQGVSGLLMRNDATGGLAHWSIFLHDRGGTWFDKDNKISVSTPLALEAFEDYAKILRRVGPPELQQGKGLSVLGEFQAGRVAAILEQSAFAPQLIDPTKSAVADFVGYTVIPSGPKGAAPLVFSWISAISNLSKKKEAAWLWVQWHTGKEVALRLGVEAGLPPSRKSAWEHADFKARAKNPDLNRAVLDSLKQPLGHGDWLPPVVNVGEARPIAGKPIVVAIQGGDFKAAAREATAQLQQMGG